GFRPSVHGHLLRAGGRGDAVANGECNSRTLTPVTLRGQGQPPDTDSSNSSPQGVLPRINELDDGAVNEAAHDDAARRAPACTLVIFGASGDLTERKLL